MRVGFYGCLVASSLLCLIVVGCRRTEHHAPRVEVLTPGYCGHNVPIRFRLFHDEPDASVKVEFSQDGGRTWLEATEGYGGDGKRNLSASKTGVLHTFAWDSLADIVDENGDPTMSTNVLIRITPYAHEKGAPATVGPFVVNNTDNVPPTALLLDVVGDCGNIIVKYIVSDDNGDAAKVNLQFDAGGGFVDATIATNAGGDATTRLPSNFPDESGDDSEQLDDWTITGIVLGTNTDTNGKIYAELLQDLLNPGTYILSLYSDSAKTNKVAEGTITGNGRLTFSEVSASGISGAVDVTYITDDTDIELLCGRIHYLVWDSLSDLGYNYVPSVQLRVVPSDSADEGDASETVTLSVDNRPYPDGNGLFYDAEIAAPQFGWHWSIATTMTDFNTDGRDDIVVACYAGTCLLVYDSANNRLTRYWIGSRSYPRQVLADDLDSDGTVDIFLANKGPDEFWWHDNANFGCFSRTLIGPQETRGAVLADFDNDGDNDIFVCNLGYNYIWRNDGNRDFASVVVPFGRKEDNRGAAVADFDNDGNLDIYICGRFYDMIHFGNGDCTFNDASRTNIPQEKVTSWRAVAFDYDGDGDTDIFVSKRGQNRLLRNDGNGNFDYETNIPTDGDNSRDVAHFSHNGIDYLLIGNRGTPCRLYRVYERRLFDVTPVNLPLTAAFTYGVSVGDVNGDGNPDAYIANDGYDVLLLGR